MSRMIKPFSPPEGLEILTFLWSGATRSDDEIRALALGAYYAESWGGYHDAVKLETHATTDSQALREKAIAGLHHPWNVTNRQEALACVRALHRGLHSPDYEVVHPLVMERLAQAEVETGAMLRNEMRERHHTYLNDTAGIRGYDPRVYSDPYNSWYQAIKLGACESLHGPFPAEIHAWDLARSVLVIRSSCTAGYLTEDEAWPLLMEGLEVARARYASWRQYGHSYLTGFLFWYADVDLAETRDMGYLRLHDTVQLWQHPMSPWRRVELHPEVPALTLTPRHALTQEHG